MSECESVRGEWGERCPDCGQVLPNPPRVTSWMSERARLRPDVEYAGNPDARPTPNHVQLPKHGGWR